MSLGVSWNTFIWASFISTPIILKIISIVSFEVFLLTRQVLFLCYCNVFFTNRIEFLSKKLFYCIFSRHKKKTASKPFRCLQFYVPWLILARNVNSELPV